MKKCSNLQCALGVYGGGLFVDNDCFCSNCGGKLVPKEEVNCQCGHRLGDNDKFCSGCGLPREEAVKKDELKEVAELVHETTHRILKDANMSLPREEAVKTKPASSSGFVDISGEKLNPTVEDIELARSYIGKSERDEITKNNARLDAILEKWGYSIPIRENEPPVPVEKVKQLVDELKEFISSLPPPSRRR